MALNWLFPYPILLQLEASHQLALTAPIIRLRPAFAAGALGHGALHGGHMHGGVDISGHHRGSPDSVLLGRVHSSNSVGSVTSGMGDRCESWNSVRAAPAPLCLRRARSSVCTRVGPLSATLRHSRVRGSWWFSSDGLDDVGADGRQQRAVQSAARLVSAGGALDSFG